MGSAAAVVLAAGASSRFGGFPKALVPIGGEPAVLRVTRICEEEGFEPCVVVGAHALEVRRALSGSGVGIAENPEWVEGRTGSIQRGLDLIPEDTSVLLWPVDHPFVQAMTLRRLGTAAEHDAMGVWFIPTFDGSGGHPVLLKPPALARVRDLRPSTPLRSLLSGFGPQVVRLPVDDAGVCANVNTPEDLQRYQHLGSPMEDPR